MKLVLAVTVDVDTTKWADEYGHRSHLDAITDIRNTFTYAATSGELNAALPAAWPVLHHVTRSITVTAPGAALPAVLADTDLMEALRSLTDEQREQLYDAAEAIRAETAQQRLVALLRSHVATNYTDDPDNDEVEELPVGVFFHARQYEDGLFYDSVPTWLYADGTVYRDTDLIDDISRPLNDRRPVDHDSLIAVNLDTGKIATSNDPHHAEKEVCAELSLPAVGAVAT